MSSSTWRGLEPYTERSSWEGQAPGERLGQVKTEQTEAGWAMEECQSSKISQQVPA